MSTPPTLLIGVAHITFFYWQIEQWADVLDTYFTEWVYVAAGLFVSQTYHQYLTVVSWVSNAVIVDIAV